MENIIELLESELKVAQETKEVPELSKKMLEMGELVVRTYLGKNIKDFNMLETNTNVSNPVTLTAIYRSGMKKLHVARFSFFDFDDVMIEGGLVKHSHDEKIWFFSCSSGFLAKNYPILVELLKKAGISPQNEAE